MCGDFEREREEVHMTEETQTLEHLDIRFLTVKKELMDSITDAVQEIIDLKRISCELADKHNISRKCVTVWALDQLPTHTNDIDEEDEADANEDEDTEDEESEE